MTLSTLPPIRERGRPRTFDPEKALDDAMIIFRQKGYNASSIADLSQAMNLTAGSIYKAFKDKRTLFIRVFERYLSQRNAALRQRLQLHPTGREKIFALLTFYLESARELEGRRGCLVAGSTMEFPVFDEEMALLVRQAVERNRAFLISLVQLGQQDGSVSAEKNAETLASLLLCVAFGMRTVGKVQDVTNGEETIMMLLGVLD